MADIERIISDPSARVEVEMGKAPSMKLIVAKVLWRGLCRKQGELAIAKPPLLCIKRRVAPILATRLTAYKQICGDEGVEVPPVFVQSLFVKLLASLLIHPQFPVSPYGIIHVNQTINAYKPLKVADELDLSCELRELRVSERGIELDVLLSAAKDGEVVWDGLSTFITRSAAAQARGKSRKERKESEVPSTQALFDVPEDTGRRYAYVSDDYNLIHLYPFTAKMMGFKRAIAHGIWTLGRAVAALPEDARGLPCHITATFKRPLFLPGAIGLTYERNGQGTEFRVLSAGSSNVHLQGSITLAEKA